MLAIRAIVSIVPIAGLEQRYVESALRWKAMSATLAGSVKNDMEISEWQQVRLALAAIPPAAP